LDFARPVCLRVERFLPGLPLERTQLLVETELTEANPVRDWLEVHQQRNKEVVNADKE
jgi:hypothetical protein